MTADIRSADTTTLLVLPTRRVTFGDRAFPGCCGASVEQSSNRDQGRLVAVVFSAAKAHLFRLSYNRLKVSCFCLPPTID